MDEDLRHAGAEISSCPRCTSTFELSAFSRSLLLLCRDFLLGIGVCIDYSIPSSHSLPFTTPSPFWTEFIFIYCFPYVVQPPEIQPVLLSSIRVILSALCGNRHAHTDRSAGLNHELYLCWTSSRNIPGYCPYRCDIHAKWPVRQ